MRRPFLQYDDQSLLTWALVRGRATDEQNDEISAVLEWVRSWWA